MDFNRPARCRWQRTGREDRRSNFYEISDILDETQKMGRTMGESKSDAHGLYTPSLEGLIEAAITAVRRDQLEPEDALIGTLVLMRRFDGPVSPKRGKD